MSVVASMSVLLTANAGPFQSALAGAGKSITTLQGQAAMLDGVMKKFGAGLVAAFAVDKIVGVAQSIDKTQKFAETLGVANQEMVALGLAAGTAGVGQDQLQTAMAKMVNSIDAAAKGTGTASDAFRNMGVDAKALVGLGADAQLAAIGEGFRKVGDAGTGANAIMDIFGTKNLEMKGVLEMTNEEMEKFRGLSASLGLSITDEQAKAIGEMGDTIELAGKALDGFITQLLVGLTPVIQEIADGFIGALQDGKQMEEIVNVFKVIGFAIEKAYYALAQFMNGVQVLAGPLLIALVAPIALFSDTAKEMLTTLQDELYEAGVGYVDATKKLYGFSEANTKAGNSAVEAATKIRMNAMATKEQEDAIKKADDAEKKYIETQMKYADQIIEKNKTELQHIQDKIAALKEARDAGAFKGVAGERQNVYYDEINALESMARIIESSSEKHLADIKETISSIEGFEPQVDLAPEDQFKVLENRITEAYQAGMLGAFDETTKAKMARMIETAHAMTVGAAADKEAKKAQAEADKKAKDDQDKANTYWKQIEDRAGAIAESMETPQEKYAKAYSEAVSLMESGKLDMDLYNRYVKKLGSDLAETTNPTMARGSFTQVDFSKVSTAALAMQGDRIQTQQLTEQKRTANATEKIAEKIDTMTAKAA